MPIELAEGKEPVAGYTLKRELGAGGFGAVWEALAPGGVRVALKFVRFRGKPDDPEWREIETIREIRHPHLLDVQFAVRVDDHLIIAMPLCDRSLKDRLEECRKSGLAGIPLDELAGYMGDLAEAVDYLNETRHPGADGKLVGVQHRDIKPQNVFLVGGSARLADFGLAKALETARAEHSVGYTPEYAAPEMFQGEVSAWTDQYLLGITYYHLRTGRLPFHGSVHQLAYAHVTTDPDLSTLTDAERPIVARALAKRPEDRWRDCRTFVRELRRAMREQAGHPENSLTVATLDEEQHCPDTTESFLGDPRFEPSRTEQSPAATRARPAPWPKRSWGRRPMAAVSAFLGLLVIASAGGYWSIHRAGSKTGDEATRPGGEVDSPSKSSESELSKAGGSLEGGRLPRPYFSESAALAAIRSDLEGLSEADRPFSRYFTLANLNNDSQIKDAELDLARAGVAKLINSLSWKPKIVVPRVVGKERLILAVDLRELGWDDPDLWRELIRNEASPKGAPFLGARDEHRRGYPYGLTHPSDRDAEVVRLAAEVYRLSGTELPAIRADWFLATASRPPLYERILALPETAGELEKRLGVDVEANFLDDKLARAGFSHSGVATHGRVVERHTAGAGAYGAGAYWKTYDFRSDEGKSSLTRLPLGPAFSRNRFPAFESDGSEILFNLPDGLQAYMITNGGGRRIAVAPVDLAGDSRKTAGTVAIVSGLSCFACHAGGMVRGFTDEIREGNTLSGDGRAKVEALYVPPSNMNSLMRFDEISFIVALEKAVQPLLGGDPSRSEALRGASEPISAIAHRYHQDLDRAAVAAELGLQDPQTLRVAIESNPELRRLGLAPLLQDGGTIKRSVWESLQYLNSPFQETAAQLERGTPHHEE
jgi:serine/threonine-protein kinase